MKTFAQCPKFVAVTRLSRHLRHPLRLLALTAMLAISATVLQSAHAAPGAYAGGHGGGHGASFGGGQGTASPRHLERMLDSADATPDQRAQIKQIVASAREAGRALRAQGQALRDQSAALFAQPNVDARAAEALRQQMLAQHDQASQRRMQTMLDISRVLSPEQRQKLAERMKQRGAMMERHRGERKALDGAQPR